MIYLFDDEEKQKELKIILESWLETPFRHHCGVKGKGCDCIHFTARVLEEMDVLVKKDIPEYPKDWHLHNTREKLSEGFENRLAGRLKKVNLSELKNGDIILSHYGRAASHSGIYFDGYVYQALTKIGVRKINFKDKKFRQRMKFAYRIKI